MTDGLKEITPDDSVVPVYLDSTPMVPGDIPDLETPLLARASAIAKLMALDLTEEEALAVVGR